MNTEVITHLKKHFTRLQAVYLFGSVTKGVTTTKSDIERVEEEYYGHKWLLRTNFTKQDSIILNLSYLMSNKAV